MMYRVKSVEGSMPATIDRCEYDRVSCLSFRLYAFRVQGDNGKLEVDKKMQGEMETGAKSLL